MGRKRATLLSPHERAVMAWRAKYGIPSINAVAEAIGVPNQRVYDFLDPEKPDPNWAIGEKIIREYGCDPDELRILAGGGDGATVDLVRMKVLRRVRETDGPTPGYLCPDDWATISLAS